MSASPLPWLDQIYDHTQSDYDSVSGTAMTQHPILDICLGRPALACLAWPDDLGQESRSGRNLRVSLTILKTGIDPFRKLIQIDGRNVGVCDHYIGRGRQFREASMDYVRYEVVPYMNRLLPEDLDLGDGHDHVPFSSNEKLSAAVPSDL